MGQSAPQPCWGIPVLGKRSASPAVFTKQQQISARDLLLKTPARRMVTDVHHQKHSASLS